MNLQLAARSHDHEHVHRMTLSSVLERLLLQAMMKQEVTCSSLTRLQVSVTAALLYVSSAVGAELMLNV